MVLFKHTGEKRGEFSDFSDFPGYYTHLGYYEEGFERAMVKPVVPNQDLPLALYQNDLGCPNIGHILPHEFGSYCIFVHLLQVSDDLVWALGRIQEIFYFLQDLVLAPNPDFQVSTQGSSLVHSSKVSNLGGSETFYYLKTSFGDRCPM